MGSRISGQVLGGVLALVVALPCSAGPKEDAHAAVEQWAVAFNSGDVDKIVALYTPDALVLGTVSPSLASTPDALRAYFAAASASKSQVKLGEGSAVMLSPDSVAFAGFYEFLVPRDGRLIVVPSRYSLVMVTRDGAWRIVHHHSSLRPKPPQ